MLELGRRIFILVMFFGAIACFLNHADRLVYFRAMDFQADQKKSAAWKKLRQLDLEAYIARKTKDRLRSPASPEAEAFLARVYNALLKPGSDRELENKINRGYRARLFMAPDDPALLPLQKPWPEFGYIELKTNKGKLYLGMGHQKASDYVFTDAPSELVYPWRTFWPYLLALGILAYFFPKRKKPPQEALYYSRAASVVLVDILGLFLGGVFFAFPFLIIPSISSTAGLLDFDTGFAWLTLAFWFLTAISISLLFIAGWYVSLWVELNSEELVKVNIKGRQSVALKEIKEVSYYQRNAPKWLVYGLLILGSGNPTATGQAFLISANSEQGIQVTPTKGKPLKIMLNSLRGHEKLLDYLKEAGFEPPEP